MNLEEIIPSYEVVRGPCVDKENPFKTQIRIDQSPHLGSSYLVINTSRLARSKKVYHHIKVDKWNEGTYVNREDPVEYTDKEITKIHDDLVSEILEVIEKTKRKIK